MKRLIITIIASLFYLLTSAQTQLERLDNGTARIVVNGKPMLMIGGEFGNS